MKNLKNILILILSIALTSSAGIIDYQVKKMNSKDQYTELWKKVKTFREKGLPKSALEVVDEIYNLAVEDDNKNHLVKALIHKAGLRNQYEEDGLILAINLFENAIDDLEGSHKRIVESLSADLYSSYKMRYLYKIRQRLDVSESDDIATWNVEELEGRIFELYKSSISNVEVTDYNLDDYALLLTQDKASTKPSSLHSLLIQRALRYFENSSSNLSKPTYAYVLNDQKVFGSYKDFISLKFYSRDSSSYQLRTLELYQDLLSHLDSIEEWGELSEVELKRFQYLKANYKGQGAFDAQVDFLKRAIITYKSYPAVSAFYYEMANLYHQKSFDENSSREIRNQHLNTALAYCENGIQEFPKSNGHKHCQNLKKQITKKEIQVNVEQVYIPGEDFLYALEYRNLDKVYARIYNARPGEQSEFRYKKFQEKIDYFNDKKAIRNKVLELPFDEKDFVKRIVEIPVSGLDKGSYWLVLSDQPSFKNENGNAIFVAGFQVSSLSYSSFQNQSNYNVIVSDRKKGDPIEGVRVQLYSQEYNPSKRKEYLKLMHEKISDSDGTASFNSISMRHRFFIKLVQGDHMLDLNQGDYLNSHQYRAEGRTVAHIFTDRSIYRPGQVIYYKALLLKHDKDGIPHLQKENSFNVTLRDAHGKEVSVEKKLTNEFGTADGSFTVPVSGLNGSYTLQTEFGSRGFRVEEYKRPKFEVTLEKATDEYKLDDTIVVSGNALALAGYPISKATVKYRVVRKTQFMHYGWYWNPPGNNTQMEITSGVVESDDEGKFDFKFVAVPDLNFSFFQPLSIFEISVEVTDVNGETQFGRQVLRLGSHNLILNISHDEVIDLGQDHHLKLSVTNFDLQPVKSRVSVEYELLHSSAIPKRTRYWSPPTHSVISEEQFNIRFSSFGYMGDDRVDQRKSMGVQHVEHIEASGNDSLELPEKLRPGLYRINLSTSDKDGNKVEAKSFVHVIDRRGDKIANDKPLYVTGVPQVIVPGGELRVSLTSGLENLHLNYLVESRSGMVKSEGMKLRGTSEIVVPIDESFRGGAKITLFYTYDSRPYKSEYSINVPWSNKKLDISFSSFRDILLPGQKETWEIKISGPDKDKVHGELLASLYDKSLDALYPHSWNTSFYPSFYTRTRIQMPGYRKAQIYQFTNKWNEDGKVVHIEYKAPIDFSWFGYGLVHHYGRGRFLERAATSRNLKDGIEMEAMSLDESSVADYSADSDGQAEPPSAEKGSEPREVDKGPSVRKNLNELVFFYPSLKTDKNGDIRLEFEMNEALTKWRLMLFAHTTDLKIGFREEEVVTQKKLMVVPNSPRFFRQGDSITLTSKVVNLTENQQSGEARLKILNPINDKNLSADFITESSSKTISIEPMSNDEVSWTLRIPKVDGLSLVKYEVVVESGKHSDGESNLVPILTDRMLVTESINVFLKGGEEKNFGFMDYEKKANSESLVNHGLTLEFTSNPVWYAVQALPYLSENPKESSDQIANRLFANGLAKHIAHSNPRIKNVLDQWVEEDSDALLSNLEKNKELKRILLEETPWLKGAENESEAKKRIALLFDINKMAYEKSRDENKLVQRQLSNGGFSWFHGGRDNLYISQYIAENLGHLRQLTGVTFSDEIEKVLVKLIKYIDARTNERYRKLKERVNGSKMNINDDHLDQLSIHYLYVRSFYPHIEFDSETTEAFDYYSGQSKKYWLTKGLYAQALIAMHRNRTGDTGTATQIASSLLEQSTTHKELGRYWKVDGGYYWYDFVLERQAAIIELLVELDEDSHTVDELRTWLLSNKRTTHWKTTKSTAASIYALLINKNGKESTYSLDETELPDIRIGPDVVDIQKSIEAGTGYIRQDWGSDFLEGGIPTLKIRNNSKSVAWGGAYWQYFEDLKSIQSASNTPLKLKRTYLKREFTDRGVLLTELGGNMDVSVGDQIVVRLTLETDRSMDYVHLKDMRASGFEPESVLSTYKHQRGLFYYQSSTDVATNFFFEHLPRGKYVFEYPLRIAHSGTFSTGISEIQCYYAPEFSSHSDGSIINVN